MRIIKNEDDQSVAESDLKNDRMRMIDDDDDDDEGLG